MKVVIHSIETNNSRLMKIFLSHANIDIELIGLLKRNCANHGLTLLTAEHVISVDKTITEKIEILIKQSDIALFLITKNGAESSFVREEKGYVQALKKPALFIVQKGLEIKGFNYGRDTIELYSLKPDEAIKKAISILLKIWKRNKETKAQEKKTIAVILGIIGFALLSD